MRRVTKNYEHQKKYRSILHSQPPSSGVSWNPPKPHSQPPWRSVASKGSASSAGLLP